MNSIKRIFAAALAACAVFVCVCLTACSGGGTLLRSSLNMTEDLTPEESASEEYVDILSSAERFAAGFAEAAYAGEGSDENMAVSPISVYAALSLAAECSAGETREQILDALGVDYDTLLSGFGLLYRSVSRQFDHENGLTFGNSVWVNDGTAFDNECLDSLSKNYFCDSYSADFAGSNKSANRAVRDFILEKTNGLIDIDPGLDVYTCFALINTLYLKDTWYPYGGGDLALTGTEMEFTSSDGTVRSEKFLSTAYIEGKAYDTDEYSVFHADTSHGYSLKLILPAEGVSVRDVFTADVVSEVSSLNEYVTTEGDGDEAVSYYTRCLFPEFEADYDSDVIDILRDKFGITDLFDKQVCDLSRALPDDSDDICCTQVRHVTDLAVDKTGIEGAAVAIAAAGNTSADGPRNPVFADFVVDRAFGYILEDSYGTTLFSGVVNDIA